MSVFSWSWSCCRERVFLSRHPEPRGRSDNLYTDCVVALDADTGKLRWHYQFTPHDVWDFDGVNEMVLVDLHIDSQIIKGLVHADRNGHLDALDRTNGKFLYAKPFVRATWACGFSTKPITRSPLKPITESPGKPISVLL